MHLEATERHAFWASFYRIHLVQSLNHPSGCGHVVTKQVNNLSLNVYVPFFFL